MKRPWALIVAPSGTQFGPDSAAAQSAGALVAQWRTWAAATLIMLFALTGLWRALLEPSLGLRFVLESDGQISARDSRSAAPLLSGVQALVLPDQRIALPEMALVETSGALHLYSDQARFHALHRQLWQALAQPALGVESAQGLWPATPRPKGLGELGALFWVPWLLGLMSMSVGLAVWVYRPGDTGARWYGAASVAYAFYMLVTACASSRLLTQDPRGWVEIHQLTHLAGYLHTGAFCMLLLRHPSRLHLPWLPPLLWLWVGAAMALDVGRLVPNISLGYQLPSTLLMLPMLSLFALQWRACAGDPVLRARLKWFGLLLLVSFAVVSVGFAMAAMGQQVRVPLVYGFAWLSLLFLGLVPLVAQVGLFQLERWWTSAWLWFLGGLGVVVLDLALLAVAPLSGANALGLSVALMGWVYFPLRQALWRRMSQGALPDTREVLPDIVALVTSGQSDPARLNQHWQTLWDRVYQPQQIRPSLASGAPRVVADGHALQVPGWGSLQGLELTLPERGRRLFNHQDQRRAGEIVRLVQHGLASNESYQRGVREERQRIASDLHDDLGAKLLTIVQSVSNESVAYMARQALEEMRLSVRGLTSDPAPLDDVLADWRAEAVSRLSAAGVQAQWQAPEPAPNRLMAPHLHGQLTRILREAVSNTIRHSRAQSCRVRIDIAAGRMRLQVDDDGCGIEPAMAESRRGHGLSNMERRVRQLGGSYRLESAPGRGTRLALEVPIELG